MGIKRRRISAFVIDMFLIIFLAISISSLNYINPYKDKYDQATQEYNDVYQEVGLSMIEGGSAFNEESFNELVPILHKVEKYNVFLLIWYLVFYFSYFVIFAYFNDGQTIGKKLFKIKVVDKNENKASILKLGLRSLINGSNFYLGMNIVIILEILITFINDSMLFFNLYSILRYISFFIEIILVITLIVKKDNRALNDIVGGTKVISLK